LLSLRKTGFSAVLLLLVTLCLSPAPASAAYYYQWGTAPSQMYSDPSNDAPYTPTLGQNLVTAWHAFDGTYHYFRLDLASAPSYLNPPGYADTYGLYIDSKPGGAPSDDKNVPGTISGIDYIVSTALDFQGKKHTILDWDPALQRWRRDEFQGSDNFLFQALDGGKTLEWRVKEAGNFIIGSSFTWWAASMLPGGDHSAPITYDLTGASVFPSNSPAVPIPSAAWLLGSGVIGLIGLKRRRAKSSDKQ
jgi:hypothetical protein